MNLLLDTHTFIWYSENSPKLSSSNRGLIENKQNITYISRATFWEIAIKVSIGKLELKKPIENNHIFRVLTLPYHHKDPFDRMIIAQAITENLTVITHDPDFKLYEVKVM